MAGRWSAGWRWCTRHPLGAVAGLGLVAACLWYGWIFVALRQARAAAEQALAAYDFDEAKRQLARGIRLAPGDAALRLRAAQTARRDGDLDAAVELLRQHEEIVGRATPEVELEYSLMLAQRGQVQEVVAELIAKLDIRHPASEQILEALAGGAAHNYHLTRAALWTDELRKRSPKNAIGRLISAQTEDTRGRLDQAMESLRELVAEYPAYRRARHTLAMMLLQTSAYQEAIPHLEELHRRQPDALMPLLSLALCWQRLDQVERVRPLMRQLEEQHPDQAEALLACGRFALTEQRLADAERLLRSAVARAPNDAVIHRELAACLNLLGKQEEADQHLQRHRLIEADLIRMEKAYAAMLRAPDDPGPRLEAGQICLRNGQAAEGLRWLYGVLELEPGNRAVHQALADHFTAQGNTTRAGYHSQRAR